MDVDATMSCSVGEQPADRVSPTEGTSSRDAARLNDATIRRHFHQQVLRPYHLAADTLVLDELGLRHGKCRADIAVVNGHLIGYEIKSDEDSLRRLGAQVQIYSNVFDSASVITTIKHLDALQSQVPMWWRVILCRESSGGLCFEVVRDGGWNPSIDGIAIAQLLWKTEAVAVLQSFGESQQIARLRRSALYERLTTVIELPELQRCVRECLRARRNWRHRQSPFQGDGLSRPTAM